ncbi:hypothetical protein ScPMuIL_007923 [Solemya velum]
MEMEEKTLDGAAFHVTEDKAELLIDSGKQGDGRTAVPMSESTTSEGSFKSELSPLHKRNKPRKVLASGKSFLESHGLRLIIISAILFAVIITIALVLSIYFGSPQVGANAAVSSDVSQCSVVGLNILQKGGNAVDSAIATMFCVGVINPQSSGIGGGGFMLVHDHKTNKNTVFDFREVAPSAADSNMFGGDEDKRMTGGLSVAVPGELKGMEAAHKKYGALPWKSLVQPAIDIARDGYTATRHLAHVFENGKIKIEDLPENLAEIFVRDGKFIGTTEKITRPKLADSLEAIAKDGADAFYNGQLTDSIVAAVINSETPGRLTKRDLQDYSVVERETVASTYHEFTIVTTPAPSSGPVLLLLMNILEGYKLTKSSSLTYHRMLEAFKFGYASQSEWLADPSFVSSVFNYTQKMISKDEATAIRNQTSDNSTKESDFYTKAFYSPTDKGTSHISVIDPTELMVSVTTTVNSLFGSQVMTDTGIVLNNQMYDFATPAQNSKNNKVEPGKRPLSNIAPVVVYTTAKMCDKRAVLGGANGSRILTGVAETLVNLLSFKMDLKPAIEEPRIHAQLYPDVTEFEDKFDPKIIDELEKMGHKMTKVDEPLSEVQGVLKIKNDITAHADSRKGSSGAATFTREGTATE